MVKLKKKVQKLKQKNENSEKQITQLQTILNQNQDSQKFSLQSLEKMYEENSSNMKKEIQKLTEDKNKLEEFTKS